MPYILDQQLVEDTPVRPQHLQARKRNQPEEMAEIQQQQAAQPPQDDQRDDNQQAAKC